MDRDPGEIVLETLKVARGKIHIAFDGWRTPNRRNLYGIAAFFETSTNRPEKIILNIPEVAGRHFGATIAGYVIDSITAYQIGDKLGFFTLDNASNNDTAIDEIRNRFGFDGRRRRCRCPGHRLNISAKALLFGKDVEAFESELDSVESLSKAEFRLWQKRGPVGKLHNLVVIIHRTDLLSDILLQLQKDQDQRALFVVFDNDKRWLSRFYMIKRALRLRRFIEMVIVRYRQIWEDEHRSKRTSQVLASAKMPPIMEAENQLTDNDWTVLSHFVDLPQRYENTHKLLEGDGHIRDRERGFTGSYGNIWQIVQAYEYLLHHLETFKAIADDFPDLTHFKIGVNMAWKRLNEYYVKLDETPVFYASLALCPAYRWDWFESRWEHRIE